MYAMLHRRRLLLCLWLLAATAPMTAQAAPVHARIRATLDEAERLVSGRVALTVTNDTGAQLDAIPLMVYPNHLAAPSDALDAGLVRWIYPKGRSSGAMRLGRIAWNGALVSPDAVAYPDPGPGAPRKSRTVARVQLPTPLADGETGRMDIHFETRIPIRRGRFGTYRGTTVLAGGWFPRPLPDLRGLDETLPPDRLACDVAVTLPAGRGAVLHDRIFPVSPARKTITADGIVSEAVVLVVMKRLEVTERRTAFGAAVHVHQAPPHHQPSWRETTIDRNGLPAGLPDPGRIDYSGRILDVVENTAAVIQKTAPGCPISERIVLVDIPAWDRMVQFGPGPVLVSDRLYRLMPVDDGLFFHDLSLVRSAAPALFFEALSDEPPYYRFVAADMAGVVFSELYSHSVHDKRRTVEEIISFASMIPSVDDLIYAPTIPFKEVYFKPIEEPDPLRDEPWYFSNDLPRGKRIAGKLEDLVGRERVVEAIAAMLQGEKTFVEAVTDAIPGDEAFFFEQWFSAFPKVNYRVANITDTPLGDGRIAHRFEVFREGAVIREPVTVRITDQSGQEEMFVWDSADRSRLFSWVSSAPVDDVIVDPHGRLVEAPELTADHPLSDNSNKLPLRPPMFTRLVVWADVTSGEPFMQIGFWLRRKYDTTNVLNLDLEYTPSAYGALVSYYRFFGPKRTLNARTWMFGPDLSVTRYDEVADLRFPDDARMAATMGSIGMFLGRDTRAYGWDPLSGSSFTVRANYAMGMDSEQRTRHVGRLHASGGGIFAPGLHHTIALYGGVTAVFGGPVAANLTTLSSRYMLRGFDSDETYGRFKLYGVMEYRHTLLEAAQQRAPLMTWFDRFQGALFVGAGSVSTPSGDLVDGLFSSERLYTEVGYGIRTHLLLFGVQQYLIAVDVAVPLTPTHRYLRTRRADGTTTDTPRSPYKVIIGITQTF